MVFPGVHGYRCIADDRRGDCRSGQPWNGNEMNIYADDLSALVEKLDLKTAIHVGHSMGGREVARYIVRASFTKERMPHVLEESEALYR
jgi:non-heme chloroperoxidase